MEKNVPIMIKRVGSGFQIFECGDAGGLFNAGAEPAKVISMKKDLGPFLERHFVSPRPKDRPPTAEENLENAKGLLQRDQHPGLVK